MSNAERMSDSVEELIVITRLSKRQLTMVAYEDDYEWLRPICIHITNV